MSDQADLEHRYRRLLACYPRAFREGHEEEILVVLLADARGGRRWPGLGDTANLIANALLMRGRLRAPRSTPTVFWAVRLMMLAAACEVAALVTVVATTHHLLVAVEHRYPAMHAAHAHAIVTSQVLGMAIGAPIAAGLWLWLAWSNDRGRGGAATLRFPASAHRGNRSLAGSRR